MNENVGFIRLCGMFNVNFSSNGINVMRKDEQDAKSFILNILLNVVNNILAFIFYLISFPRRYTKCYAIIISYIIIRTKIV